VSARHPVVLIAAVASNGVIGRDNQLIWRLKSDLKRFRALTMGKPVIMGRKTFDSIGRPLPGRHLVVLTRDRGLAIEGVRIRHSIAEALAAADEIAQAVGASEVMVAGGAAVYAAFLPLATGLDITHVALDPAGDAVFPPIDPALWQVVTREDHPRGPDDEAAFSFVRYRRRSVPSGENRVLE
jgi:dihydrofolate reductase